MEDFSDFAQETSDQYTSFEEVSNDPDLMSKFADFIKENEIAGYVDGENELESKKKNLLKRIIKIYS